MHTIQLKRTRACAQNPGDVNIPDNIFFLNNVILPKSIDPDAGYNPHNVRAWCIGNECGPLAVVWAVSERSALYEACNLGALDSLLVEDQDYGDETSTPLGNASELFGLSYVWLAEVQFDAALDIHLIVKIVRACELGQNTLDE